MNDFSLVFNSFIKQADHKLTTDRCSGRNGNIILKLSFDQTEPGKKKGQLMQTELVDKSVK